MDLGHEPPVDVAEQADARSAVVVESLRVADVLEADGETRAAANAVAPRRVAGPARETDRVAGELLGLGLGKGRATADDLGDRKRAVDALSRGQHVTRAERVPSPDL